MLSLIHLRCGQSRHSYVHNKLDFSSPAGCASQPERAHHWWSMMVHALFGNCTNMLCIYIKARFREMKKKDFRISLPNGDCRINAVHRAPLGSTLLLRTHALLRRHVYGNCNQPDVSSWRPCPSVHSINKTPCFPRKRCTPTPFKVGFTIIQKCIDGEKFWWKHERSCT